MIPIRSLYDSFTVNAQPASFCRLGTILGGHFHALPEQLEHIFGSGAATLSFHFQCDFPRYGKRLLSSVFLIFSTLKQSF
jgi:hypothetical protein